MNFIIPKTPLGQLAVGYIAVVTALSTTISVAAMAGHALLRR
ncbi:hypothetical protein LUCX_119 [Xanthomonas phage vB_XciM_LucasX]|nr:hypothetical protein LUCX_119 [Xanthomonas phage vB_XciM_LucasX]